MTETTVVLLGASTRAAATSARRAGWRPWCADLFADADLERVATVTRVAPKSYPHGLLDALADAPNAPVIYTGALENRPDLIAKIKRPLWGNSAEVVRAVRTPARWVNWLKKKAISCPAVQTGPPSSGTWLLKPRRSAGGLGIQAYSGQCFNCRTHFLQERIAGIPCSAVFLGHDAGAELLGVTVQLIGASWLNSSGYRYAGSIGPVWGGLLHWIRLGNLLAKAFPLRGLFGVDAVERDGVPCPVEINPRYTASVELLERSYGAPLLTLHRRACLGERPRFQRPIFPTVPTIWGKAILYARRRLVFPAEGPWQAELEAGANPDRAEYADIPHPGDVIEQDRPVMTVFASGATVSECEAILKEKARALDRRLWG